ncbi:REP-associated tyrosine transposase [Sedimenticola hydrogenitrophicus]|uniref:REP-associated tyrosine transposase n=1 Tax=Sedimenticola hydrogenitrophicus TaxID=2967975 RepID=UPI0023B1F6EE|nr:transposase [Sedimenticola hydrogenitrophicus]
MTEYRRYFVPGGTFFFTVNLLDRNRRLLTTHIDLLRQAFSQTQSEHPFRVDAIVVLPDHLHTFWSLPPWEFDFSTRWRKIKARFSRGLPNTERISQSRQIKGERGIWQRRYWEHAIRDERDYRTHVDYIHFNPVKHRHCLRVGDWPFSSFNRFVQAGIYPADWAGGSGFEGRFGE